MDTTSSAYHVGQILGGLIGLFVLLAVPVCFILALVMFFTTKKKGWLFLLIPSALGGLALVALFVVGFMVGMKEVRKATETQVISSTDSLVHLTVPGNWKLLTKVNDDAQLQAGVLGQEQYMLIFNESKADFKGGLDDYAEIVVGHIRKTLTDPDVSDPEKLTINGLKAVQYKASGSLKGLNLDYLITVVESPEYFHQIVDWTLRSKKEKAMPIFRTAVASFAVNKDGPAATPAASPAK